jgi:hypothetical protein
MFISVVMCTRNRAQQLRRVLDSAARMAVPTGVSWEFVLVDNGSTDDTGAVAQSYADRLPIRCVREETPGLSNARNRGVAEARGDYICWTDDDVVIDALWLAAYAKAFKSRPEAAFFGGVIEPVLEGVTPTWMAENRAQLGDLMAARDFGPKPIRLDADHLPYGANYAVKASVQRAHCYDASLGVGPGLKRLGEETTVLQRMLNDGGRGFWVPRARVRHVIPQTRQTLRYVSVYEQSVGETWAHLAFSPAGSDFGPVTQRGKCVLGAPRWLWKSAAKNLALFLLRRYSASSEIWLENWRRASRDWGAITYLRRERVQPSVAGTNEQPIQQAA